MSSPRPSSPISRGRSSSPSPLRPPSPTRGRRPPYYVESASSRSPRMNPLAVESLSVPPPICLRSSSPSSQSSKGTCKLHIPAWGVVLVRPPQRLEQHPLETGGREPPREDTVLTGALEVTMKERRRCQAISVGVQSVCRLDMGSERGWEEDGIFERGVEVLGGDAEGIWLEKGSQSFKFSILLPATLATHDHHTFGRISYILTARVEGIPSTSITKNLFRTEAPAISAAIPFKEDFETVIARSDKLVQDTTSQRLSSRRQSSSSALAPPMRSLALSDETSPDDSALAFGEGSPLLSGLYHRRQSSDIQNIPPLALGSSTIADDARSIHSVRSSAGESSARSEKTGWLKGDLLTTRSLIIHANPSPSGGVTDLDLRKEGYVAGLGSWRFTATSDVFSISAVILLSIALPSPGPKTTVFFARLLLSQSYTLVSPRTPNVAPRSPGSANTHLLYQVGNPHRPRDRFLGHDAEALWRGPEAGGGVKCESEGEGWKTRAVARLPNHETLRPSTNEGTMTPIRVTHELQLQIFYSVEGETVARAQMEGPGDLRKMQVKIPIIVPSCCCSPNALTLPIYDANDPSADNIDDVLSSPPGKQQCMCGNTFAELGEAAMKRLQTVEVEEGEALARMTSVGSGSGLGSVERWGSMSAMEKEEEEEEGRRNSSSCDRPRGSS